MTWADAGRLLCLTLIASGLVPVLAAVYQYLLLPMHAIFNHWGKVEPYLPRVVVLVPAWNEADVLDASLTRLMGLEYPPDRLKVFVVDDASTDRTPEVVQGLAARYPGRIVHLRREKGGEGKAHTLNHGIRIALADDWMEAMLIMDADVVYRPDSLRRMTRHLSDPKVGAVTAYIKEGSAKPGPVARFIGYEYITAQAAARRSQNVLGALACLAGGAQLHSRHNLVAVGGGINTTTLAEDTYTTMLTELQGRKVVFEPTAVVLAEEPDSVAALWKQRLRWARGNVQITRAFRRTWFRPYRTHGLGSLSFGLIWFSVLLLPIALTLATAGILGLFLFDESFAAQVFSGLWWVGAGVYLFITLSTLFIDLPTARRTWFEGFMFPGIGTLVVMSAAWVPDLYTERIPGLFGGEVNETGQWWMTLVLYSWAVIAMSIARALPWIEKRRGGRRVAIPLLYLVGFGPVLCAISVDSFVKEWQGAAQTWDKTEKSGKVVG
ncbi:glycosyltransferase [Nocardioides sp. YIM 152588]|uniref:glycosyltransferase n=1 Tax=Nocardioides sp. YIM 152588 TaxID=3158259 RepID=UPI0032E3D9A1